MRLRQRGIEPKRFSEISDRALEIVKPLVHQAAVGIGKGNRMAAKQFVEIGERLLVGAFGLIGGAAIETRHGPLVIGAGFILDDAGAGRDQRFVILEVAAIGDILHRRCQRRRGDEADQNNEHSGAHGPPVHLIAKA
jgi:hypothetical protein